MKDKSFKLLVWILLIIIIILLGLNFLVGPGKPFDFSKPKEEILFKEKVEEAQQNIESLEINPKSRRALLKSRENETLEIREEEVIEIIKEFEELNKNDEEKILTIKVNILSKPSSSELLKYTIKNLQDPLENHPSGKPQVLVKIEKTLDEEKIEEIKNRDLDEFRNLEENTKDLG